MKAIATLLIVCVFGVFTPCHAQSTETKQDSSVQMNLLDEQVKVFSSVFRLGGAEESPLQGATNYLELLDKIDLPEEQKKELTEMYNLYNASLDPKKKEELKVRANKMMQDAMNKSLNEQ